MVAKQPVKMVETDSLVAHPDNALIYGKSEVHGDFVNSVEEKGILTPLVVSLREAGQHVVLSGHRRWQAAGKLGIPKLPCIVRDGLDELEERALVVIANKQRAKDKSIEQREVRALLQIQQERAAARQREGAKRGRSSRKKSEGEAESSSAPDGADIGENGRATDKVAQQLGMKPRTVQRIARADNALREIQEQVEDEELKEALTTMVEDALDVSPSAAERLVETLESEIFDEEGGIDVEAAEYMVQQPVIELKRARRPRKATLIMEANQAFDALRPEHKQLAVDVLEAMQQDKGQLHAALKAVSSLSPDDHISLHVEWSQQCDADGEETAA